MTTKTPQPTCSECHWPAEIAEHEWPAELLCVPCALELRGRPTQADLAAADSARFAAEERTEEYRRLVESRDEALTAALAGIDRDVEVTRLRAAIALDRERIAAAESAREEAEKENAGLRRECEILDRACDDTASLRAYGAEERRRALEEAAQWMRRIQTNHPIGGLAELMLEALTSAPAPLPSRPLTYLACPYSHPD